MTEHVDGRSVAPEGVLRDLTFEALPDGWTPTAASLLIRCLDKHGEETWSFRTSEEHLSEEELLGVLTLRTAQVKQRLLSSYD